VPRWNASKYRSPGLVCGRRRRLPQKSAAAGRTKIKTDKNSKHSRGPPTARARQMTKPSRLVPTAVIARATDAKPNGHTHTPRRRPAENDDAERRTADDSADEKYEEQPSPDAPRVRRIRLRRGRFGGGVRTVTVVAVSSARALRSRRPRARKTYGYHCR